jgi:hypothetical protein
MNEKQLANYWYMKGVKDAETTVSQDVELSQTLKDFETHFELQYKSRLRLIKLSLPTPEEIWNKADEMMPDYFIEWYKKNVSNQSELLDFKNWWNELPDESDDRLFITKGTIDRFLKSNS